MMNQMGHNNMGPGPPGNMRFGGPGGPPGMGNGPRGMVPRGQGFQSIPPSGPMMRQQAAPPNMMGNGPGDMPRMRIPPNHMMGPGMPNGPQKVPVSHPSPQHAAGSPAGMWNNMGSGSPNPNGMPMQQQQSIGSPRTPGMTFLICFLYFFIHKKLILGDQNHGSPMMQQNMRSQTPGMNPVPNSQQGMGQPRMVGPQGNVSLEKIQNLAPKFNLLKFQMGPMNSRMSMMPQNMMHQMHPGQQQGQPPPQQPSGQGNAPSPAQPSPHMSHASPMGVNHPSPHMQNMHMNANPAKNTDDYNLDFLDSIPNDDSGANQNADQNGSKNNQNSGQPGGGGGTEDDFMTLLDS